jgi:hypothetical protein
MEAPGEENGLVNLIVVGKPASVERHTEIVRRKLRESHQKSRGRPGGRPRTRGSAPPSNRIRITSTSPTLLRTSTDQWGSDAPDIRSITITRLPDPVTVSTCR